MSPLVAFYTACALAGSFVGHFGCGPVLQSLGGVGVIMSALFSDCFGLLVVAALSGCSPYVDDFPV